VKDPQRKHSALLKKFIRAIEPGWLPDRVPEETWADKALHGGQSLAVSAYLMVGLEANVPRTFRLLIPAFREHYGFSDDELVFFVEHLTADEQHGEDGARLVSELAATRQERLELLEGVNKGATAWWWFHRSCHTAISSPGR
jgi:pyrroloquinoline quinone (PQQ) biosynthesis protein C